METGRKISSYRDLLVWQKGVALAKIVYKLTAHFPDSEKFGLTSPMRRAAVSVPSNMAEGQARQGRKEFVHFLSHAESSLAELDTQVLLSFELGSCSSTQAETTQSLITELQKMLSVLRLKVGAPATIH